MIIDGDGGKDVVVLCYCVIVLLCYSSCTAALSLLSASWGVSCGVVLFYVVLCCVVLCCVLCSSHTLVFPQVSSVCVLFFVRHYQDRHESEGLPTVVCTITLCLALATVVLLPVDIYSCGFNSEGCCDVML